MRNLPNEKREDRTQEATDIEYFAGISVIFSRIKLCGEQAERIVEDDNKIE